MTERKKQKQSVDGRHKAGHDDQGMTAEYAIAKDGRQNREGASKPR
jgi:hypothetical protein